MITIMKPYINHQVDIYKYICVSVCVYIYVCTDLMSDDCKTKKLSVC